MQSLFMKIHRILPLLALFAIALFGVAPLGYCQTVSPFQGLGTVQFFDNNGEPLTAGVLYSFAAGTTTQQPTYTDSTGITPNPNPIPFGSGARVNIWLTSSLFYKFQLCRQNDGAFCAPSDVLFSVDNVPGLPGGSTGGSPFTGTFISGTTNPATTGILRLATADTICWRNAAGTSNVCLSKTSNDVLSWTTLFAAGNFVSTCTPVATSGFFRLCSTDTITWRNNANSGDVSLSKNASDNLSFPNCLTLNGGVSLCTTNQSGTGSICLATNCQLVTPALNGVVVSGAPTAGQALCASSPTAAAWCNTQAIQLASTTNLGGTVNISGGSPITVISHAVTMPSSGCPCRVFAGYGVNFDGTNSGLVTTTVFDGTTRFGTNSMNTTGSTSDFAIGMAEFSGVTYANSAVVTFTLQAATTMAGTTNAHAGNANGLGQSSHLNLVVVPSL